MSSKPLKRTELKAGFSLAIKNKKNSKTEKIEKIKWKVGKSHPSFSKVFFKEKDTEVKVMSFKHSCFTFIAFWISNMKHLFSCFHFHQLFGALSVVPALSYTHHVLYYKDL